MTSNRNVKLTVWALLAAFSVLLSVPYLVPHLGWFALFAFIPILFAEKIATRAGIKHFFAYYYAAFALFNLLTTWWVCKATVGGGIFASLYSALFMSAVFAVFRFSKKSLPGPAPYVLLACLWIAWEKWNLVQAEISWPWLVLGNAFAGTTRLVQWYEYTGTLGGSAWVWIANLSLFSLLSSLLDSRWKKVWNAKARAASLGWVLLIFAGPCVLSAAIYSNRPERSEGTLEVCFAQSDFDPFEKFVSFSQKDQNDQVLALLTSELQGRGEDGYPSAVRLLMLPETFTSDIWLNYPELSPTWQTFLQFIGKYPNVSLLFGASTHESFPRKHNDLSRKMASGEWYDSYNTAFLLDRDGSYQLCHKSKLVVGTELTPYPKIFVPLDDALGGVMGRCQRPSGINLLNLRETDSLGVVTRTIPLGVPICYESIYPEFCTGYVRAGAPVICVITNDGWWGNTAGYRQHFSYSRLRAIELRRDIARCANTGISGVIDQRGDVRETLGWWKSEAKTASVNLNSSLTFFASHGDIIGRICVFFSLLLLALSLVQAIIRRKQ